MNYKSEFITDDLIGDVKERHEYIVALAKQYTKGFFIDTFNQEGDAPPTHKSLRFCSRKDLDRFDLSEKNAGLGLAIKEQLERYDYGSQYLVVTEVNRIFHLLRIVPFDEAFQYRYALQDTVRTYKKVRQNIQVGDIVRLKQPYKVDDLLHNQAFLAALGNENYSDRSSGEQIFQEWQGFTFGIVHQVLSKELDGSSRRVYLFLYYPQANGVWLTYPCVRNVPNFKDFNVDELELYYLSEELSFDRRFVSDGT